METKLVTVTPQVAAKVLELCNVTNRNRREYLVKRYTNDMLNGRWITNHQGLAFGTGVGFIGSELAVTGSAVELFDGQHRLASCVRSEKPLVTLVTVGMTKPQMEEIDTGKNRSDSDSLAFNGYASTTSLAAIARIVYLAEIDRLDQYGAAGGGNKQAILSVVRRHPELVRAVAYGRTAWENFPAISTSLWGFLWYWLPRLMDEPMPGDDETGMLIVDKWSTHSAHSFLTVLRDGVWHNAAALPLLPAFVLRKMLIKDAGSGNPNKSSKDRMRPAIKLGLIIKAWRAQQSGGIVKCLKMASNETYPNIDPFKN